MVDSLGGFRERMICKAITHVVAENTDNDACREVVKRNFTAKIVHPRWIDDCMRERKRVNETPYLLSHLDMPDTFNATPHDLFKNRRFYLENIGLSSQRRTAVQKAICDAGGVVLDDMTSNNSEAPELNVYICKWRNGPRYVKALRDGWVVASLQWLYAVLASSEWKSPYQNLLHFPKCPPYLEGWKIALNGLFGKRRVCLAAP